MSGGITRVSGDEGKAGCIGKYAHAREMYAAKYVIVAECVLGILHPMRKSFNPACTAGIGCYQRLTRMSSSASL